MNVNQILVERFELCKRRHNQFTGSGQATDVDVRISAPSWVARGGSATLRCLHQVPPQLLYKVEFLRSGSKVLQYVRERNPPYTNYTFPGGKLNVSFFLKFVALKMSLK